MSNTFLYETLEVITEGEKFSTGLDIRYSNLKKVWPPQKTYDQ